MDVFNFVKNTKNVVAVFKGSDEGTRFKFKIEKAIPVEMPGRFIVEGVASSLNVDHDQERMALPALQRMANIINERTVPLRIEHQKNDDAIVGKVFAANVDERGNLNIKTELDPNDPRSPIIYNSMKSGTKLGFSVGGRVRNAVREMVESLGQKVRTFYDVILDEVSLTPRPANFDAFAVAKSITKVGEFVDMGKYLNTPIYDSFLFENPQLDYLAAIEKSIPDSEWIKVDQSNEKDIMNKFFNKEESSSSEESEAKKNVVSDAPGRAMKEETETADSKSEETATKSFVREVVKSEIRPLVDLLRGISKDIATVNVDGSALDGEQPTRTKKAEPLASDVESDQTERQTGKVDTAIDAEATDQNQPAEKKPDDGSAEATKSQKYDLKKAAEALIGVARKLLKADRTGQEDTVGNGDLSQPRQRGEETMATDAPATDQNQPPEKKPDPEAQKSLKRRVKKNGLDVPTGTVDNTGATDTNNPAEAKTDDGSAEASEATKSQKLAFEMLKLAKQILAKDSSSSSSSNSSDTPEMDDAMKETDSLVATHDLHDKSEKTNEYGEEYKVSDKSVKGPLGSAAPLDLLVAHIQKSLRDLTEKLESHGNRVLGLESQFMDDIHKNDKLQKSLRELAAIPGQKKSYAFGNAYIFTKEGKRLPLIRVGEDSRDAEGINKSQAASGEDFASFWKREKSTIFDNESQS